MKHVLIVEPDRSFADLLAGVLADVCSTRIESTAQSAVDWLDQPKRTCDMVITELFLGDRSGVELVHELRSYSDWTRLPVVVHSRVDRPRSLTTDVLNNDYGIIDFIKKGPHSVDKIKDYVRAITTI